MPRTDLPYTYLARGRYWRFRHPLTGDCKLPGVPGESAFNTRYGELLAQVERRETVAPIDHKSFTYLIKAYRNSKEFAALADATQIDYERTLRLIDEELGVRKFALTTHAMIKFVRDAHGDKSRKAHKIKQMVSALYTWAGDNDLTKPGFNPAATVKRLKRKGGQRQYVVWSTVEFDMFFAGAIEPMRTAAMLARYTGQRAKDLARMTWGDFQGGDTIRVRQSKTGAPLDVACHRALRDYLADLKRTLDASKARTVTILRSTIGMPYNANSLSSAVGREVRRIDGMPIDRSIHGLRYTAGSDMAEAGCTVDQLQSVLGHHTFKMAMKYASQRLQSREAAAKREGNEA